MNKSQFIATNYVWPPHCIYMLTCMGCLAIYHHITLLQVVFLCDVIEQRIAIPAARLSLAKVPSQKKGEASPSLKVATDFAQTFWLYLSLGGVSGRSSAPMSVNSSRPNNIWLNDCQHDLYFRYYSYSS